jgi:hypothetical protein
MKALSDLKGLNPFNQMDKFTRVSHVVTLLKRLTTAGIPPTDIGYKETKKALDFWILEGEPFEADIEFMRYGRVGHLEVFKDKTPTLLLKVIPELKDEV